MARLHEALSAAKVKNTKVPGVYADGNGLYLRIEPSGAKRWFFRYMLKGKRRDMGLGSTDVFSLKDARAMVVGYRQQVKLGIDPIRKRQDETRKVLTFEEAASLDYDQRKRSWTNKKQTQQWINTLATYVFPTIGSTPLDEIKTSDVICTLSPIWLEKPDTASKVKQRMSAVFDWAKANGHLHSENPVNGAKQGLPKQPTKKAHHASMAWRDLPAFFKALGDGEPSQSVLALQLLILTAARTSEIIEAQWSEFDLDNAEWIVPAERMKAKKEHRVPLSDPALAILKAQHPKTHNRGYVFMGGRVGKPLSNMAMAKILKTRVEGFTVHGFRSTFRDWSAETTNFPNEVCEQALAHTVSNSAEAAYRRGTLFEKRRELMAEWGRFVQPISG